MSSSSRFSGRGGRQPPEAHSYGQSDYWRTANSPANTRPMLPLFPPTVQVATNSSWAMTRSPSPPRSQPKVNGTASGPTRPPEYLDQFFSSLKLDEMKESKGIFPQSDQLPPKPQEYGPQARGREPTFRPPPTLFQLEAQERMRPTVLGGRSHKDKLGSVAESWDDTPPTVGFSSEERILGMFEIPPDPPSRSGSPFRDETWLGPNQSVNLTSYDGRKESRLEEQSSPPPWSTTAYPPIIVDNRPPTQVVEPLLHSRHVTRSEQLAAEPTARDETIVVATLGDEGMEEPPKYSRRQTFRQAKADAFRLARAGTTHDPGFWIATDGSSMPNPESSGYPRQHEQDCPGFSSPVPSHAGFDSDDEEIDEIVLQASPSDKGISERQRELQRIARPTTLRPETNIAFNNEAVIPSTPAQPRHQKDLPPHVPSESQPNIIVNGDQPTPQPRSLISPIRSLYLSTPQTRLEKMQKLNELRRQLEAGVPS